MNMLLLFNLFSSLLINSIWQVPPVMLVRLLCGIFTVR
jgi:hypothetical protein